MASYFSMQSLRAQYPLFSDEELRTIANYFSMESLRARYPDWSDDNLRTMEYWFTQVALFSGPFLRAVFDVLLYRLSYTYTLGWILRVSLGIEFPVALWILNWLPYITAVVYSYLATDVLAWATWDLPNGPNVVTLRSLLQVLIFVTSFVWLHWDMKTYFLIIFRLVEPGLYAGLILVPLDYINASWTSIPIRLAIITMGRSAPDSTHWSILAYALSVWKWRLLFTLYMPLWAGWYPLCLMIRNYYWLGIFARIVLFLPSILCQLVTSPCAYIWVYRQPLKMPYWYIRRRVREWWHKFDLQEIGREERESYSYLGLEPGYIRILEVDRVGPEIRCRLIHSRIHETGPYEAISYTWGRDEPSHGIVIDDRWLQIRTNAYNLLHDRASRYRTRRVWLDCICINQQDPVEKEIQIPLMPQIYRNAERTIVWLGEEPDAEQVLSLLLDLQGRPCVLDIPRETPTGLRWCIALWQNKRPMYFSIVDSYDFRYKALAHFLANEWFFRIWILQEVIYSSQIHIRAGSIWIDWKLFTNVMKLFSDPETSKLGGRDVLYLWMADRALLLHQNFLLARAKDDETQRCERGLARPSLAKVAGSLWEARATDPRDMIFGLLNLCREANRPGFDPDYSLSTEETYLKFAHLWLSNGELHQVLPLAGVGRNMTVDVPSWVPDWSCLSRISPLQNRGYAAGGRSRTRIDLLPLRTLTIRGVIIDSVAKVTEEPFSCFSFRGVYGKAATETIRAIEVKAQNLIQSLPLDYDGGIHHGTQPREEAFWRTLIGDSTARPVRNMDSRTPSQLGPSIFNFDVLYDRPAPMGYGTLFRAECAIRTQHHPRLRSMYWAATEQRSRSSEEPEWWNGHPPLPEHESTSESTLNTPWDILESNDEFSHAFASTAVGRKFAITKDKRMALTPPGAKPNDLVCVFVGIDTPFLLRIPASQSTPKEYLLVGECYIHGIMDKEALDLEQQRDIRLI